MKQPAYKASAAGFTLVELLVVIGIIGLLLTLLSFGSGAVIDSVRRTSTEATMRNVSLAIDSFSQTNPLRNYYDQRSRAAGPFRTFGSLPPYQVPLISASSVAPPRIGNALDRWVRPGGINGTLAQRLTRDLSGGSAAVGGPDGNNQWVALSAATNGPRVDINNDIRALYAYLAAYEPAGVSQIPMETLKPLPTIESPSSPAHLDPQGRRTEAIRKPGTIPGADPNGGVFDARQQNPNWINVYGIHDAWGVPLDYMVYAKVEPRYLLDSASFTDPFNPGAGGPPFVLSWNVVDLQYAIRSHGISREAYDERVKPNSALAWDDRKSIYSSPLPQPYAQVGAQGEFLGNPVNEVGGGWVRVVGENEPPGSYGYVPQGP